MKTYRELPKSRAPIAGVPVAVSRLNAQIRADVLNGRSRAHLLMHQAALASRPSRAWRPRTV